VAAPGSLSHVVCPRRPDSPFRLQFPAPPGTGALALPAGELQEFGELSLFQDQDAIRTADVRRAQIGARKLVLNPEELTFQQDNRFLE
jgi:hypothetical protein